MSPGFTPRPSLSVVDGPPRPPGPPPVSPGFTPRPSLSGVVQSAGASTVPGVAGVHAPAFVERSPPAPQPDRHGRVAGVHAPAFVERTPAPRSSGTGARVSPGFTPRPSLSGASGDAPSRRCPRVSPGFTPRPSLSAGDRHQHRPGGGGVAGVHAPAFVERGLISGPHAPPASVAGVHAPAFVERSGGCPTRPRRRPRVAGVHAPAFVERGRRRTIRSWAARVSPGFTPRPSLSVVDGRGGG